MCSTSIRNSLEYGIDDLGLFRDMCNSGHYCLDHRSPSESASKLQKEGHIFARDLLLQGSRRRFLPARVKGIFASRHRELAKRKIRVQSKALALMKNSNRIAPKDLHGGFCEPVNREYLVSIMGFQIMEMTPDAIGI